MDGNAALKAANKNVQVGITFLLVKQHPNNAIQRKDRTGSSESYRLWGPRKCLQTMFYYLEYIKNSGNSTLKRKKSKNNLIKKIGKT